MSKNLFIVPHDFTSVGDAALNYALHIGNYVETELVLLHVIHSKEEKPTASRKLDELIDALTLPEGVTISKLILEGSIFEQIGRAASTNKAQLIIMGTHGMKGFQKLFGSNAMKVITNAETPFLIVQKDTPLTPVKKIVVPIDLSKESLQIISVAGEISEILDAEIHVIGEKESDEFLSHQIRNRVLYARKQYDDRKIECKVELIKSGGSYAKKILAYTEENDIGMIAFAYHSESFLPQFETFAQSLITNSRKIPCMVLNSKQASSLYF
jgi:nucleotide-binding universal stress UspA family protein